MSTDNPYEGKVKTMDGEYIRYQIHPECPVCQAKKGNKKLRLIADKKVIDGAGLKEICNWFRDDFGITVTPARLRTHINKHSEYIGVVKGQVQKLIKETSLEQISTIADQYIPAEEVLSDIITKGGQKIKEGVIEVDGKLLLGAMKEQGNRKKTGTLQDLWKTLNRSRFDTPIEGEVLDG